LLNPIFQFYRTPRIVFSPGAVNSLGEIASSFGPSVLVVLGNRSLKESGNWLIIEESLKKHSIQVSVFEVPGEPSPELVDSAVNAYFHSSIDCVIGIGGGSVIDAGKAISAMLRTGGTVSDYLEGMGTKRHNGEKVPFIAVPTTAGTGSEASANAVLSDIGPDGYKRSIRHDNFCPDVALVDPNLALSCPASVTAACGMDAFTQLLESYVSDKASPFTDALVESALPLIGENLVPSATDRGNDINTRCGMAYASLISGITLANAGLGAVHGFASVIGGYFHAPHGAICGSLLGAVTRTTIEKLHFSMPHHPALAKYSLAGSLVNAQRTTSAGKGVALLLETIDNYTNNLGMPRLSKFGMTKEDIERITMETGNKNNPIKLDVNDFRTILKSRL
jgi:alcohol dehydrogenase class IV